MATIILGIALSVLDGTIVNLALPGIARDLQVGASQAVWVVNAYQVAILALLLPLALLGDVVGHRRVYLAGQAVFTLASFGCALAPSLEVLVACRALQGFGAAGVMAVNAALVRLTYPKRLLGRGIAINSVTVATASVAGPSIAALVLSVAHWPWLFAVNLPLGAIVLWLGWRALPPNGGPAPDGARLRVDDVLLNAAMFVLIFLGVGALVAHVGAGSGRPAAMAGLGLWGSLALLAAGAVVGVVHLRRQRRQAVPLFPVDLLRLPVLRLSIGVSIGAFAAQMLSSLSLPFLMIDAWGRSTAEAGAVLTAWPVATVLVAPLVGRMIGRWPAGLLGGIGLATMGSGLALLAMLPSHPAMVDLLWRMALCGVGFGLFQSPNNHTILTSAPLHRSGGASGLLGTARLCGQSLAAVGIALAFALAGSHGAGAHDGRAPTIGLIAAALAAFAGAVFSLMRLRHRPPGSGAFH